MTRKFRNRTFSMLTDLQLPKVLKGGSFEECLFESCCFGQTEETPDARRVIRDVSLVRCTSSGSALGPVIVESVEVEALKTRGVTSVDGAVFKRVRISGECGRLLLNLPLPGKREKSFRAANDEFYRSVDWALDISAGAFAEIDIRGVPADLVRRDPNTQLVARRSTVARTQATWRNIDLDGAPWGIALHNMLEWELPDTVLVAPLRSKNFTRWMSGLQRLLEAGVLER